MDTSATPAPEPDPGDPPRRHRTGTTGGRRGTGRPGTGRRGADTDAGRPGSGRHRGGSASAAPTTTGRSAGAPASGRTDTSGPSSRTSRTADASDVTDTDADAVGPSPASRRRRTVLLLLGLTAVTSATALVIGLLSWAPDPPEPARPLTVAEAERLAAIRVTNLRDLRSGVHVTAGTGAARTELVGWVDWSRPLLYLDVGGPGAGADRGLLQSTGSVLVIRPDPTAVPTPAAPPLVPPPDRWRLHRLTPGAGLAPVLDLLRGLSADRPDPADGDARWVAREVLAAGPVDVVSAPLHTTTAPAPASATPASSTTPGSSGTPAGSTAEAAPEPSTRYWLDQDARLHKLTTRLPGVGPVTVLLNRVDRPTLRPVDALGGRPGLPRALTDAEQRRVARLPVRLRAQGGATVTLSAPVGTDTNLRGSGWLSWTAGTAYLAVADLGAPERRTLLHRAAAGLSRTDVPAEASGGGTAETPGRPPLPVPAGTWRPTRSARDDLDLLVDAAVAAAGPVAQRGAALRIREDVADGRIVDVVELRTAAARLRYWIERDGSLRRVELHTGAGVWAQLDLSPAVVPRLDPPPTARTGSPPRPGVR
ncbi:hypothetical protein ACFY2Q_17565 [Micromonospora sp. NPDC000316]|uniref:hypothetical protein n=1 Tax=Micromonospora sp. NPDC000316 TaxID=3364216 RepID=UPI0036BAD3A7